MSDCDCNPTEQDVDRAKWLPNDQAWVWACPHGHEFIRRTPQWERLYTLEELKERFTKQGP